MMGRYGYGMHGPMTYGEGTPFVGHTQGLGPVWMLDLTQAQRTELGKIQDGLRKQHWELQGKLQDQYTKLRDLQRRRDAGQGRHRCDLRRHLQAAPPVRAGDDGRPRQGRQGVDRQAAPGAYRLAAGRTWALRDRSGLGVRAKRAGASPDRPLRPLDLHPAYTL
jgi:hypothetical protein